MSNNHLTYTYLIGWSNHNKWYYGRRTAKNCHPNEFWKTYFTSSKYVKEFRKKIMTENNPSKLFRISCCHCGKQMSKSNHTKWHGEKCKLYLSRLQSGT